MLSFKPLRRSLHYNMTEKQVMWGNGDMVELLQNEINVMEYFKPGE